MLAAYYDRVGGPEVLQVGEIPTPWPGPGEVRVRVHVSAVNPSDSKRRAGWDGAAMPHPRVVPHNDGAGVIDATGPGVPPERVGERVWVFEATIHNAFGTAATFVVVRSACAIRLPDGAGFELGASLGVPAMTAHRAVFSGGPVAGKTVLVAGGAGSVGRFAVQLARWAGAAVIATAGSPAQAEIACQAGATSVFGYKDVDLAERIEAAAKATISGGVDRIVEVQIGRNIGTDARVIRPNGTIISYASSEDLAEQPVFPLRPLLTKSVTVQWIIVYTMPQAAKDQATRDITHALEENAISAVIAKRFPLNQIAEAHRLVGLGGAGGKVLVQIA
jgi:NADPH2:quinone reductase